MDAQSNNYYMDYQSNGVSRFYLIGDDPFSSYTSSSKPERPKTQFYFRYSSMYYSMCKMTT